MQITSSYLDPVREEPGQSLAALLFFRDNLNAPFKQGRIPRYTVRSLTANVIAKRGMAVSEAYLSPLRVITPDSNPKRLGARILGRGEVVVPTVEFAATTNLKAGESVRDVTGRCVATVIKQRDQHAVFLLEAHSMPVWSRGKVKSETTNLILDFREGRIADDFRATTHEHFPDDAATLGFPAPDLVATTGEEILAIWSQWSRGQNELQGSENLLTTQLAPEIIVCHPDTWAKVEEASRNRPFSTRFFHKDAEGNQKPPYIAIPSTSISQAWRNRGLVARIGQLGILVHPNVPTCRCYLISDPLPMDNREGIHTFRSAMPEREGLTVLAATEKGRDIVVVYEEVGMMLSGEVSCQAMWVVDSLEALPAVRNAHLTACHTSTTRIGQFRSSGFFGEDDDAFMGSFLDLEADDTEEFTPLP